MASKLYYNPFVPAFSNIGVAISRAKLYFYYTGTSTPAPIYSDSALTVPLTNPVQANLAGKYVDIYLSDAVTYRVVQTDKNGAQIGDAVDPYIPGSAVGTPGGNILSVGVFTDLTTIAVPTGTKLIQTTGYTTTGFGADLYVNDTLATLALATANPRACKADAAGRYFRLLPRSGEISILSLGAKTTVGMDDQPAVQAAVNYAAALGGTAVRFPAYAELWRKPFPGGVPDPKDGAFVKITQSVPLYGQESGTTLAIKNSSGGTFLKTDGDATWYAHVILYDGAGPTSSIIRDITIEGGVVFANVYSNAESNIFQKGVCMEGIWAPNIALVDHRNLTIRNLAAELWYRASYNNLNNKVYVNKLTLEGSPQCCWNPASLCQVTAVSLRAGIGYQPVEGICPNHAYIDTRFYDGTTSAMLFTESFPGGYLYSFPHFTAAKPLWCEHFGTRFESIGSLIFGSRQRGKIMQRDTPLLLVNYGKLSDIDLDIDAVCDAANNNAVIGMAGVPTLTTLVTGAPALTYYEPPRDINIRVRMSRTNAARTAFRKWACALSYTGGLIDVGSVCITVSGQAAAMGSVPARQQAPLLANSQLPLVLWDADNSFPISGGWDQLYPGADFTYDLNSNVAGIGAAISVIGIGPNATGLFTMTLANASTFKFTHGHRLRIVNTTSNGNADNRKIRVVSVAGLLKLRETRILAWSGDYVDLEYDQASSQFIEKAFYTKNPLVSAAAPNVSFGVTDVDANSYKVASGAGTPTLTLPSAACSVGLSFQIRFTTAWAIACAGGLSKNAADPTAVTTGNVAANSVIEFYHEGAGVWLGRGTGLT